MNKRLSKALRDYHLNQVNMMKWPKIRPRKCTGTDWLTNPHRINANDLQSNGRTAKEAQVQEKEPISVKDYAFTTSASLTPSASSSVTPSATEDKRDEIEMPEEDSGLEAGLATDEEDSLNKSQSSLAISVSKINGKREKFGIIYTFGMINSFKTFKRQAWERPDQQTGRHLRI